MKIFLLKGVLLWGSLACWGCSSTGHVAGRKADILPAENASALSLRETLYVKERGDGKQVQPATDRNYVQPKPHLPLTNLMMRIADIGGEEPMTPPEFRSPAGARFMRVEF